MLRDFFEKPFTIDRIARIVFTILFVILIGYIINKLSVIILPFFLAWMVAFLLMPVVYFFQNKLKFKNRFLSVITVLLLGIALLVGVFMLVLPSITSEIKKGWELIQFYASPETLIAMLPESMQEKATEYMNIEKIFEDFDMEKVLATLQGFFNQTMSIISGAIGLISSFTAVFFFLLYLIFIMIDYEDLNHGVYQLLPRSTHPFIDEAVHNIQYYINNYFKGQGLIALIVGILLAIGFRIMELPMGISIGLLIGVFNLVPYLQTVGVIPMLFASLLKAADTGQNFFVVFLISFGILMFVQLIQDTILTPKIMGKTMGMKPAIILLSLAIWGGLFGLLGMFFALPATMILYTYHMKYVVGEPLETGALLDDVKDSKVKQLIDKTLKKNKKTDETEQEVL